MTQRRVIIVTGAASGIGAATARSLGTPGTALVLHTRSNRAGLESVCHDLQAGGAETETVLGDLADPATATAIIAAAIDRFGRVDVLVSNAGFANRTGTAVLTDAAVSQSWEAIGAGFLRLARAALPGLQAAPQGRIIAVSSFVAHVFRPDVTTFPASAAAKAAVEALVRCLAIELGGTGVTVNAVAPGFIRKDAGAHRAIDPAVLAEQAARIPLRRLGVPEDVAGAVAFLASEAASYITGQVIHVDGGLVM